MITQGASGKERLELVFALFMFMWFSIVFTVPHPSANALG